MKKTNLLYSTLCLLIVLGLASCFKQEPKKIENKIETIRVERLNACTQMNLFENLLEKNNIEATFACTKWNENFPTLYQNIKAVEDNQWNSLLMPVSELILNDRDNLKRIIAVSQKLDKQGGLEDLGEVVGALSDRNFYDGLNDLFKCAEAECLDRVSLNKKQIISFIKIIKILSEKNIDIHRLFSQIVKSMNVLSSDFAEKIKKVLSSPTFKLKRMEMLDLLVDFLSLEKSKYEQKLIPAILSVDNDNNEGTVWSWINSNDFDAKLLVSITNFHAQHPEAINDLRSISQLEQLGLSCDTESNAGFFVNLDAHILDLINTFATKNNNEIQQYLENDLMQHQIATEACPNFKNIKIQLDGADYELSVIRLKKSLIDLVRVPGLLSITKIISKKLIETPGLDRSTVNELTSKYAEKNYLGAIEQFLRIVQNESPEVLVEYSKYLKSIPFTSYNDLASILGYIIDDDHHESWVAMGAAWRFFNEQEKEFIFNYIDQHFRSNSNYVALFNYYLDLYTVSTNYLPELVSRWTDDSVIEQTYSSLKTVATFFNGEKILLDFRAFFSKHHLVKIIELFVNGEQLIKWAVEVQELLPKTSINQIKFEFNDGFTSRSTDCLDTISDSSLAILIRDFPHACELNNSSSLIEKLSLISSLNNVYHDANGYHLVQKSNFLNSSFLQSLIVMLKRGYISVGSKLAFEKYIQFQKDVIASPESFNLIKSVNNFVNIFQPQNQVVIKEKMLKSLSHELGRDENIAAMNAVFHLVAKAHESGEWTRIKQINYKNLDQKFICANDLNANIGGITCPNKQQFLEFYKNLTLLLIRSNDDDVPLAVRQFVKALDPSAGLPIPLGSREPKFKNLSIPESLRMFYELSDRSNELNTQYLEYEKSEGKRNEPTTLMERVEVVIRDVNFDENYMGAHYMNSVSKSYDYNAVVDSKYKLFNVCVKAGFCGKFMNRKEKVLARNAVDAFPALLEANTAPLQYGDYMKALLSSVVSSSSKASQISSIVKFKRNGDGFNIPWIQTKKQLRKHNGKILSELAGISAFSNMARWTRDRFGRSSDEFNTFIKSPKLQYIGSNLLRGFDSRVDDTNLVRLLESLSNNDFEIISDLYDFISELSYEKLLRLEDMAGDILVIFSRITEDENQHDLNKLVDLLSWSINHYGDLKKQWNGGIDFYETITTYHPYIHLISNAIINEEIEIKKLITNLYQTFESFILLDMNGPAVYELIKEDFNQEMARSVVDTLVNLTSVFSIFGEDTGSEHSIHIKALSTFFTKDVVDGYGQYLKLTSNTRQCDYQGELVVCSQNEHYLEPWKLVDLLSRDKEVWNKHVVGLIDSPKEISIWLGNSLDLIRLP